jgi:alkylation response protein AidB-like acyl-CoA dehydrogenase
MATRQGGDWLIRDTAVEEVFTPERLSDEHRMVARTAAEFCANEVLPAIPALERKQWDVSRRLLAACGELGLLGTDVPEEYGGVGLDKAAAVVVGEAFGGTNGFATAFGAQTGLAIIPILCFGTEAQRRRYLPKIVSGELVGAYCLSEANSGSDALAARAKAVRQPDGTWVLTGEKLWITNGGFADVFIVFAKVDGEHFTAFIVERGFPGVASGKEEHKMGLHGSSTTPLILADARVPAENLLGEIGKGHKIAFNVLNYGRFKLAGMCSGGAKRVIGEAASYALTRRQFGQAIAGFGAIRHKLAEMAVQEYVLESAIYRTVGLIDAAIAEGGHGPAASLAALEEFAVEASMLKVAGSEALDFILDENVQIHGGNGFVSDYPAERHYRDGRVNRIFEGTNEINRLLIPGMLIKRAMKGAPALIDAAKALERDLVSPPRTGATGSGPLAVEFQSVASLKKAALMLLGLALETHGAALDREQELLMLIADVLIAAFAAESATLRAAAAARASHALAPLMADAAGVYVHDAVLCADGLARTALAAMREGDDLRVLIAAERRLLASTPVNTIAARRRIADAVATRKGYAIA